MSRLILFALLTCLGISISFAQDTAKKKPTQKPAQQYARKYHGYGRYKTRTDSAERQMHVNADSVVPLLKNQSLNSQYQYMIARVYHYQQPLISALWKNASDTLNASRAKLKIALGKITEQSKAVDSLKTEVSDQAGQLSRRDGIVMFGLTLQKTTYNLIMWGLVVLFAVVAIVVISRSAGHRREARHRIQLYNELEEDYKTFKTKASDKEKKL